MNSHFNYDNFKNMDCNSFIDYLLTLSANELSLLAIGIGFLLSNITNVNQQNSLGNFFELIGQLLLTISAQNLELHPNSETVIELKQKIYILEKEIEILKKSIF